MINYIYSYFCNEEKNTLTPHSMSIIPSPIFINYARIIVDHDDDEEPHKNYQEYIAKQNNKLDTLVDYWNH
mgnify:CR=1 FL=1|tara:strand:- start:596 stop:808 length:213 start_codon:yes stop_codon:yes gene_type:complete